MQAADIAGVLAAESRHASRRRMVLIGGIVAGVLLLGGGTWLWASGALRPATAAYLTAPATRADIHVTLIATGTLEPQHKVTVTAASTGTVASVDVDYNMPVRKGQALAHLEMGDLEAALARAQAMVDVQRANRDSAAASLADARAALERASALAATNAVSPRDLELARSALQKAEGGMEVAEAQLKASDADLRTSVNAVAKGTITSPIDGTVLDRAIEPGQLITTATVAQPLFVIVSDLQTLDLRVDIDEADVTKVKVGDPVHFTVEAAPDHPFEGVVSQVRSSPSVNEGVVTYEGVITVDNGGLVLKPGMTATAEIGVADAMGVLTVPNGALRFTPAGSPVPAFTGDAEDVWVPRDGKASNVPVTVGLTDGQRTAILSGDLKSGDEVITGARRP